MTAKLWYLVLSVGFASLVGILATAAAPQPKANNPLADEQLRLSREALKDLDALRQRDQLSPLDPKISLWDRRSVEALRDTGVPKAKLIVALEGLVKRTKERAEATEALQKKGEITRVDMFEAQYQAAAAEAWLIEEKAR